MQRHVTSLPLPNSYKVKLVKNGIETVNDLKNMKPVDLIKDTGLTKSELNEIYETLNMYSSTRPTSAFDLLKSHQQSQLHEIPTLFESFDQILGGGIPLGKMSEMCGAAGVGKTQISMQLCVNVQIPELLGGNEGQAVYIDTEGSFMSNRVIEIARATIKLLQEKYPQIKNDTVWKSFSVEKILENIFYFRCVDHVKLISTVNNLNGFLLKYPKVKLIVVDSLAYPFRFVDYKDSNSQTMKTNILNNFMNNAYQIMTKHNLAILVTNQMTTRIARDLNLNTSSSNLVPALGETWAHSPNLRIILSWKNNRRCACLSKSSYLPDASIFYKISEIGFEPVENEPETLKTVSSSENFLNNIKKRKLDE